MLFSMCAEVVQVTHKCTSSHACTTINFVVTPSFQIPLLHLWQPAQNIVARIMRDSKAGKKKNQSHHLFSSAFHVKLFRSCPQSVLLLVQNFWISESLLNITSILKSSSEGCARCSTLLIILYPKRSWWSNT